MQLIDTHAHLTFEELQNDVDAVLSRSIAASVTAWVTVGTEPGGLAAAVELAEKHDNMYAATGIHPHYAKDVTEADLAEVRHFAEAGKIVAVGEAGLDYHYNFSKQDAQKQLFRDQLTIAADTNLPVIVHTRNAFDESIAILDEFKGRLKDVVIHCYSGTEDQTKAILDRGFYISFTGIVTFKKSEETRAAAKLVPLDRLMIETDCPYISPTPVRNQRPCEPAMLIHTAKKIAETKEMPLEDFAKAITQTSKKFFNIK